MSSRGEAELLQTLRLCRADMIEAIAASIEPPNSKTLRELADLQLVIMATEQTIADKSDPDFLIEFRSNPPALLQTN